MSKLLEFENLNNTRDLGGMTTNDGRKIKEGLLIRSGYLFFASDNDKEKLEKSVDIIVDLRTDQEVYEKPDPKLKTTKYHHIPIITSWAAGITWEEKTDIGEEEVFERLRKDHVIAKEYMCGVYRSFATNEHYISQYSRFARILFDNPDKGVLWHCSAGKDRAGFAAVIAEEILGVPREKIIEDYMMTNVHLKGDMIKITEGMREKLNADEFSEEALKYLLGADMSFIESAYSAVEEMFGNFDNYIKDGLKIDKMERILMQEAYLE